MKKIKFPYQFDPKKRELAKKYAPGRLINFILGGIAIPIIFLFIFIASGAAALLGSALAGYGQLQVPLFVFLLAWFMTVIEFPVRFYFSYIREHQFGLSNYTLSGWFRDYLKGLVLNFIIFIPLLSVLFFLFQLEYWWLYAGIGFTALRIIFTYVLPVIVLPFFYKLHPYKNSKQKKAIIKMAKNAGVGNLDSIYVANESAKSVKANAIFAGFGRTKRIILFDTLTENFSESEIETVIAHELGHYVNRDELRDIVLQTVLIFPVLYAISILIDARTGLQAIPMFLVFYFILNTITMPLENFFSRRIEKNANLFALNQTKKPDAQISAEKRLADMAIAELESNRLVEFLFNTHPNTLQSIAQCTEWKKIQKK